MILPIYEVEDLLKSMEFTDHIFTNSIDEEYVENVQDTVVLITESASDVGKRANNRIRSLLYGVEVQIFYGNNFSESILDVEIRIAKLLEENDWHTTQSKSHINDPKTNQVTKVFYFEKNYLLED